MHTIKKPNKNLGKFPPVILFEKIKGLRKVDINRRTRCFPIDQVLDVRTGASSSDKLIGIPFHTDDKSRILIQAGLVLIRQNGLEKKTRNNGRGFSERIWTFAGLHLSASLPRFVYKMGLNGRTKNIINGRVESISERL